MSACLSVFYLTLMTSPMACAVDSSEAASQVVGSEGATKAAIHGALKMAKSKPVITAATSIVCLACIPIAGAAASPAMCLACGILIAKTLG